MKTNTILLVLMSISALAATARPISIPETPTLHQSVHKTGWIQQTASRILSHQLHMHSHRRFRRALATDQMVVDTAQCGTLYFADGDSLKIASFEIVSEGVRIRRCDDPGGSRLLVLKEDVNRVVSAEGHQIFIGKAHTIGRSRTATVPKALQKPSNTGFIIGLLSFSLLRFSYAPAVLLLAALLALFGIVINTKTVRKLRQAGYKGGKAKVGLVFSAIALGVFIIALCLTQTL